jgi:VanZ family protein
MRIIFLRYKWLTALWALFIFTMCTIDLGSTGRSKLFFPGFDKLVHCGFFFTLVVFYSCGFISQQNNRRLSYKATIIITIVAIAFGAIIELLQLTIFTWRSGEWSDLFADTVGACMAMFSVLLTIGAIRYVKE